MSVLVNNDAKLIIQGITGGAMIPTALTIIATRLPKSQQPVGTAIFGLTAIMGPVLGPLVGGWLTENFSWHYAFFINVPIGAILLALLLLLLAEERRNKMEGGGARARPPLPPPWRVAACGRSHWCGVCPQ